MPDQSEIHALFDGYFRAYAAHDADGCAAIYGPDAVLYSSFDAPLIGRDAIARAHREWFEEGEEDKGWSLSFEQTGDDQASCVVDFSAKVPTDEGYAISSGHSLCALSRDGTGAWHVRIMSMTLNEA